MTTYTVIKSNNKAWLKEDSPDKLGTFRKPKQIPFNDHEAFKRDLESYEDIFDLRTIQISPEYVDYWEKDQKVGEGEFEVIAPYIAIPAQDEAGLWDEMSVTIKDSLGISAYQANKLTEYFKTIYEIKRKR